jgi:hypothetical protein
MHHLTPSRSSRLVIALMCSAWMISGCGSAREETVAGVTVPVPTEMTRVEGQGVELSIPGLGGGQAAFEGNLAPERIIEFYKKEMPARGWQPGTSLLIGGGILSYSKEGKTVLLGVSARNGNAALSVTVADTRK